MKQEIQSIIVNTINNDVTNSNEVADKIMDLFNDLYNKKVIWLEKRISKTEQERENLNLSKEHLIAKGGKLTAYKEVLNYIKNH